MSKSPRSFPHFATPDIELIERESDVLLRSRVVLGNYARSVADWLQQWAIHRPNTVFLAQRPGGDPSQPWETITYAEMWNRARSIGQGLLDLGLGQDKPLAVLSGASIDHGSLVMAGHLVGVPIVPVSEAYSLLATTTDRLEYIVGHTDAGAVFASSGEMFGRALDLFADRALITGDGSRGTSLADMLSTTPTDAVDAVAATVSGDTIAKILFTSGSTGVPKGVITTHKMLCANQESIFSGWPFLEHEPPVICDWLPWSHTFGANHNLNIVLRNGGTMYIDGGRPTPDRLHITVANLVDVQPTMAFNVPVGWGRLVEALEGAPEHAAKIFEHLRVAFYAGSALSNDIWDRLTSLIDEHALAQVSMAAGWGMTETGPASVVVHMDVDGPNNVGTPLAGVTVKLVPAGSKTELRVAGPSITPGFLNDDERTRHAFDDEGYLITGDAIRLADPAEPNKGLVFDGRIAEDFKLSTGTWVSAGTLRTQVVAACSPYVLDAVITGHDHDWIGLIVWLTPGHSDSPEVRAAISAALATHNAGGGGSSSRIARVAIESALPSIDAGEMTDKGYINQRAVIDNRASTVDALHETTAPDHIIVI
ncbi:MAG: feruloyl-CoA synthase [Actinobacteria bacterium]|nr:feruloyl-CoA synthase [Actinomycetota bacterium]